MAENEDPVALETDDSKVPVDNPEDGDEERLDLRVEISDTGTCRKHLVVTVPRSELDKHFDKEFSELVKSASIPGFRPGKTPRKLVERRFRKDVSNQVKVSILRQSLEQIGTEQKIEPLSEPDIDIGAIELPEEGDLVYGFDVEVRPEFDLPEYKGLEIERPAKEFDEKDVEDGLEAFLRQHGTMETKDGPVQQGDYVDADIRFLDGKEVINEFEDMQILVDEKLEFRDGVISDFGKQLSGAKAGDSREMKATLSDSISRTELLDREVVAIFVIKEVKQLKSPELDQEFFAKVDVGDEGELRDLIKSGLESKLEYHQQQSAREQVMEKIVEAADWDLPRDLLRRQAERTLVRKVRELESYGFSEEEIRVRSTQLQRDSLASTAKFLKQTFVLQKIAEVEEIKVQDEDLEAEIFRIAQRLGESPRRVRARIEKEGEWDSIALQVQEDKAIEKILSYAKVQDVVYQEEELRSSALDRAAIPLEPEVEEPEVEEPEVEEPEVQAEESEPESDSASSKPAS